MDPAELERIVDRELRQLREPRAPHTLVPRVMAAARAWAGRPWYTRPWVTWPAAWQAASMATLLVILAGVALLLPTVRTAAAGTVAPLASGVMSEVAGLVMRAEAMTAVVQILWRTLVEPVAVCASLLLLLMWLALAVFGTALDRVVFGKALDI